MPNIFIKNVWGYTREDWPAVVFGFEKNRQALLDNSRDGDLVVLRVKSKNVYDPEKINKLLAVAEFDHKPFSSYFLLKPSVLTDTEREFVKNGKFQWQYALRIKKVWRINEPDSNIDINSYASPAMQAVKLKPEHQNYILSLIQGIKPFYFSWHNYPTIGPEPEEATAPATTYAFRFGENNIWKIGWTQNSLVDRVKALNSTIPYETLQQRWNPCYNFYKIWDNAADAHNAEQEVLGILKDKRTHGEIANCTEEELQKAWQEAINKIANQ